jgi:serine phosphatase RsbU (regulator of sigma subunit)
MESGRFAGYRIVELSRANERALAEIAARLIPRQDETVDAWIDQQWRAWQPPGLTRQALTQTFGDLWRGVLRRLRNGEVQECLADLEEAGRRLAGQQFPFEALIMSVHFLEESYLPFLIDPPSADTQEYLLAMDEFLHAALASIATSYFEAYRRELLEDAEVGRLVQEELLADIPRRACDLDVAHIYISSHERARLGGDFIDSFSVGPDGVGFLIGDMSGHGIDAVADSLMLRSLFRGFMREEADLARAMGRTNHVLAAELRPDHFATALALAHQPPGRLTLVSGGHPYPLICGPSCREIEAEGIALAIEESAEYDAVETELEPGDLFLAYTDGLVEAGSSPDRFGEKRLRAELTAVCDAPVRAVAEHIVQASLRHAGGRFADDVAVLVLKRRPGEAGPARTRRG